MASLLDVIAGVGAAQEGTVFARKPWTPESEAVVLDGDEGPSDLGYLLELELVHDVLETCSLWREGATPSPDQAVRAVIHYARHDAYQPVLTITHRMGEKEEYGARKVPALVAELDAYEDDEHPDVSVSDSYGWTLSAFPSGLVVWENIEDADETGPRHLRGVTREQLAALFTAFGEGGTDEVERLAWLPGQG
jgi:hypothetical protein